MKIIQAAKIIGSLGGRPPEIKIGHFGGGYFTVTFDSITVTFDSVSITFDHQ